MKEAVHKKAYTIVLRLFGVLGQVKLISGNKSKQELGVDDGGLTGKEWRGLSGVMEMFHILIGELFIWFSAFVKT